MRSGRWPAPDFVGLVSPGRSAEWVTWWKWRCASLNPSRNHCLKLWILGSRPRKWAGALSLHRGVWLSGSLGHGTHPSADGVGPPPICRIPPPLRATENPRMEDIRGLVRGSPGSQVKWTRQRIPPACPKSSARGPIPLVSPLPGVCSPRRPPFYPLFSQGTPRGQGAGQAPALIPRPSSFPRPHRGRATPPC